MKISSDLIIDVLHPLTLEKISLPLERNFDSFIKMFYVLVTDTGGR